MSRQDHNRKAAAVNDARNAAVHAAAAWRAAKWPKGGPLRRALDEANASVVAAERAYTISAMQQSADALANAMDLLEKSAAVRKAAAEKKGN